MAAPYFVECTLAPGVKIEVTLKHRPTKRKIYENVTHVFHNPTTADASQDFRAEFPHLHPATAKIKDVVCVSPDSRTISRFGSNIPLQAAWPGTSFLQREHITEITCLNLKHLRDAEAMFVLCKHLRVVRGLQQTSRLLSVERMFEECTSLLRVEPFDLRNAQNLTRMFAGCTLLVESFEPDSIGIPKAEILTEMFANCSGLSRLPIRLLATARNVIRTDRMFSGCASLDDEDGGDDVAARRLFPSQRLSSCLGMFERCLRLTRLWRWFDVSRVQDVSRMFLGCVQLRRVPNFVRAGAARVENFTAAFEGCTSLEAVGGSDFFFDVPSAITLRRMFAGCTSLREVASRFTGTWNVRDTTEMFAGCISLEKVPDFRNQHLDEVTSMEGMFRGCALLGTTPARVQIWNTSPKLHDVTRMFQGCRCVLGGDAFPIRFRNLSGLMRASEMFDGCANLRTIPAEIDLPALLYQPIGYFSLYSYARMFRGTACCECSVRRTVNENTRRELYLMSCGECRERGGCGYSELEAPAQPPAFDIQETQALTSAREALSRVAGAVSVYDIETCESQDVSVGGACANDKVVFVVHTAAAQPLQFSRMGVKNFAFWFRSCDAGGEHYIFRALPTGEIAVRSPIWRHAYALIVDNRCAAEDDRVLIISMLNGVTIAGVPVAACDTK